LAIEGLRASFFQDDEVVYQHILMASAKELDEAEEQLAATVFARRETAFALSQAFLDQIDPPATIKALLAEAIAETRQEAFVFPCFPAIDFPMALLSEGHREPPEHLMP